MMGDTFSWLSYQCRNLLSTRNTCFSQLSPTGILSNGKLIVYWSTKYRIIFFKPFPIFDLILEGKRLGKRQLQCGTGRRRSNLFIIVLDFLSVDSSVRC